VIAGKVALDTITPVAEAVRDASAVVVMYVDGKGELDARVLWPVSVAVTKDRNLVSRCYCTLRKEWRTFRLDRMVAVHPLTTPDDAEPDETKPVKPDPMKMVTRLGTTLTALAHNAQLDAAATALLTDAIGDARRIDRTLTTA